MSEIPKKIHITNNELNELNHFILQRWKCFHPDFDIFFYTDSDNDAFIEKYFKQYKETYDQLSTICKIDFIRLLYLYKYGGIYADIDILPLKSFHSLLNISPLILCKEDATSASIHNKEFIISNSLILSTAKNSFIKTVINAIVKNIHTKESNDPLFLTGPFLLNSIYEKDYKNDANVTLLSSYYCNPFSFYDFMNKTTNKDISMAFSIHLFRGSWWQKDIYYNEQLLKEFIERHDETNKNLPKISCLCVTKNHADFLERAIKCFLNQIYENKELIVIYESNNETITRVKEKYREKTSILFYEIRDNPKKSLGCLRNISLEKATGEYVCQWDDDDWYSSLRLYEQYYCTIRSNSNGSIMTKIYIMDKIKNKLYLSCERMWEGSIFYKKSKIKGEYPDLQKGEDTPFTQTLDYISVLNKPELYVYHVHNNNTYDYEHMKRIMDVSALSSNVSLREKMLHF